MPVNDLEAARLEASIAISRICMGMRDAQCQRTLAEIMGPEKTNISEYTVEDCQTLIQAINRRINASQSVRGR